MTVEFDAKAFLNIRQLGRGTHPKPSDGYSVMEAISFVSGEEWSNRPRTCCPVISVLLRSWGDAINDMDRTKLLITVIPQVVGTKAVPEVETRRADLCYSWLNDYYLKAWLKAAGIPSDGSLDQIKVRVDKCWDFACSAYRTASGRLLSERAMKGIANTGLTGVILAAKMARFDPQRDRDTELISSIVASCAKIIAKKASHGASQAQMQNSGGNAMVLVARQEESEAAWDGFDRIVSDIQKEVRKLVRILAKVS